MCFKLGFKRFRILFLLFCFILLYLFASRVVLHGGIVSIKIYRFLGVIGLAASLPPPGPACACVRSCVCVWTRHSQCDSCHILDVQERPAKPVDERGRLGALAALV